MSNTCNNQPPSLNFLLNTEFEFKLLNSPLINFFVTAAEIPAITLTTARQDTRYNNIDYPGEQINYSDLNIKFKIDEQLTNYWYLHQWIRVSGNAVSLQELYNENNRVNNSTPNYTGTFKQGAIFSDADLYILDAGGKRTHRIRFYDMFPVAIGNVSFDTEVSTAESLSTTAAFKYTYFDYLNLNL